MTKSKVDPLAALRGSTHFEDICGCVVSPFQFRDGRLLWTANGFSSVSAIRQHMRQMDLLTREGLTFDDEIAFEVYDDDE